MIAGVIRADRVAERITKLGIQSMWVVEDGRVFVQIINRSYRSQVQLLEVEQVARWLRALGGAKPCLSDISSTFSTKD
jgi:hypothetical protein